MTENKNNLCYVAKPYDVVGKVSVFPLNEDGAYKYLNNLIRDNKIIKKYGTMNVLDKSENTLRDNEKFRKIIKDADSNENKKNFEIIRNWNNSSKNLFNLNKAKTMTNWNEEFTLMKNKFREDINSLDIKINSLKYDKTISSYSKENLDLPTHNKNARYSQNKSIIDRNKNKTLKYTDSSSKEKNNRIIVDDFCCNDIPRIKTSPQKLNLQFNFKQFLHERYDKNIKDKSFRASTSNVPPKILDNWVIEENQKYKHIFSEIRHNQDKIKPSVKYNQQPQPEIIFTNNNKGDCKMMGDKYNPYNYYVDYTRHRKKRNIYGSVYNN